MTLKTVNKPPKIDFEDFRVVEGEFASWRNKEVEITLEPCLNGCDVAVYDLKQNLLEDKYCTDIKDFDPIKNMMSFVEMRKKAINKVNEYYKKYVLKEKDGR